MKPSISVAIPVYNGENYIETQIQSILNQSLPPTEIIICDDCSTDATIQKIKRILNKNLINKNIIKIYENSSRLGMDNNFEKAISLCTGDYIFLSDADDYWFKNKISYMLNKLQNSENLIALNNCRFANENLIPYRVKKIEQIEKIFNSSENFIPGCCVVFKKKLINLYLPLPSHFKSYDGWLNFVASKVSNRILVKKVFQLYRRHSKNNSLAIFNTVKNLNFFSLSKIRLKILINAIISRQKIIDQSIKNYEELINRLNNTSEFKNFKMHEIYSDLKNLIYRKSLLKQNFHKRFYNIFIKNNANIWKSRSSKIIDFLAIR